MIRTLTLLCSLALSLSAAPTRASELLYNQVGYAPEQDKSFYVADTQATRFELVDAETQTVVHTGSLAAPIDYPDGGIEVRKGDFSAWTTEGRYFLRLDDGAASEPFAIDQLVYEAARDAALKGFYFNRASTALEAAHAGAYARPLGHPDTSVAFHSSTGRSGDPNAASPKGWYDAGDFGKYVVNGGYALGTLLSLHELYPDAIGDSLDIPESGNGISDLLDECRWGIEWFLTMQDSDGGVFHKLTTLNFAGYQMPHAATAQRYFVGKSTTATLNFAATLAQAARVFDDFDGEFAATCLAAAQSAYAWAQANPSVAFRNPDDVSTGEYGDGDPSDEFTWAAAQIHLASQDPAVLQEVLDAAANPTFNAAAGWPSTRNLGLYSLALDPVALSEQQTAAIRDALYLQADQILAQASANPLGIPMSANEFFWGSNGHIASKGVLLAYAHKLSGDARYLAGMATVADYLLGRNATGYSFLTGYGAQPPTAIHHRASVADGIADPVPGFLAGGPNSGRQDGLSYPHLEPARSYVDHIDSYASNEIAVNWNAPLVLLLGALQQNLDQLALADEPADDAYRLAPFPASHLIAAQDGLLANDPVPPGAQDDLQAELLSAPAVGDFELQPDGGFTYAPPAGFVGNLYFTYRTRADSTVSAPAVVTFTVHPSNPQLPAALANSAALWLDAAAIDPADPAQTDSATSKVRLWGDRSGNIRHAENSVSATQPTLVDDALHGLPMVQFGSDAFLAVGDIRPEAGPITTFVVSRSDSTEGDGFQRLVTGYTGSGNNWEAPNYFVSRPHLENQTPHAYSAEITTQSDSGRALQNILVGVQSGNVNDFHGLIGELLIFARSLTSSETAAVEAYLADKWQLWHTLPASHSQRAPDGYAAWLWSQPQLVGENANPDADPNQNGLSNCFEYVLGLDPVATEPPPAGLLSMTIHGGLPAVQLRALADFSHRGLQLATATSLESPTWSLPGDAAHIPFEPISSTPAVTPGIASALLAPAAPLPAQVFIRLQE